MPEKQKEKEKIEENSDCLDETSRQNDRKKRDYYYDDAHGYEIYNPDENEEDE